MTNMPIPKLETIADTGTVFACIHDRVPRGGCGWYAADGSYHPVTNLGWLLRHASEIHDLWVSTGQYRVIARGAHDLYGRVRLDKYDTMLAARLTNGRVYVTTWQDADLLHDWLVRPNLSGRVVYWECAAYVIGSRDYERLGWERRQRRARERARAETVR